MIIKPIVLGLTSYIPGAYHLFPPTGGTDSARYCYAVWLRQLVLAKQHGLLVTVPNIVAELGPGDLLGIGLAALLSGSRQYYALDVVRHANVTKNLVIFDQLVELFRQQAAIPDQTEQRNRNQELESYAFPGQLLPDELLAWTLSPDRIEAIRSELLGSDSAEPRTEVIKYIVPWSDAAVIEPGSVDMIFSQAVLEHVDDLESTYHALNRWLKADGCMSHAIDYDSHHTAATWNGHWSYSNTMWKIIRGKRAYLINRQPHSEHINLLERHGFTVVSDTNRTDRSGIARKDLAASFVGLTDHDLITRSAFIQAKKQR